MGTIVPKVSPRRAGEILLDMEKAKGVQLNGTDSLGGYRLQPPSETPTYSDLGIDKRDAHIWQTLAAMPGALIKFSRKITCIILSFVVYFQLYEQEHVFYKSNTH
mgnify:CR=1 FL=1